jgi:hypothetical protein
MNSTIKDVRRAARNAAAGLVCVSLLSTGCAGEDPGASEPVAQTTEAVTFSPAPGDFGGTRWTFSANGGTNINLGSTTNRFCFISGVLGTFQSYGDFVQVAKIGSSWLLSGTRGSGNPGAEVFCVTSAVQHGETKYWEPGLADQNMGTATNRTCFLSAVCGNFGGSSEEIRLEIRSDGNWWLTGSSACGSAFCVQKATYFVTTLDLFDNETPVPGGALGTGTDSTFIGAPWACGLTRVGGLFRSGASVRTRNLPIADEGPWRRWWLTATQNSQFPYNLVSHGGTAACII